MPNCTVCAGPLQFMRLDESSRQGHKDGGERMYHANPDDKLRHRMIVSKPHATTRYDPVRKVYVKRSA